MGLKAGEKDFLLRWEEYRESLIRETPVPQETTAEKRARIARLESKPEEWFKYHFPNYAYAEPADFHKRATRRTLKNKKWYEARAWSRELAKSTRAMMETLFQVLAEKSKRNVLLISHSKDNADDLLMPYMITLECNQRIINDYGTQKGFRGWETGNFKTRRGVSFRAIGSKQSPRGTKNEEARPDKIIIDDIDTDEMCRNPDRVQNTWNWIEQALIPTVSISGEFQILFLGNLIGEDCIIKRAGEVADKFEVINIRDKNGKSTWPEKNSEEDIDYILGLISYASQQKEYYNNPITIGDVFKEIRWGKVPPLNRFKFLIAYGDPATSNKESGKNSFKAMPLAGIYNGILYVITCYLEQVRNSKVIIWYYDMDNYVNGKTQVYHYIENNSLQDPFYEQVLLPLFKTASKEKGYHIPINPDERKKPDKHARIEGNLEPVHRRGEMVFNERERNNPHMKRLEDQFKAFKIGTKAPIDGPDAVEGAYVIAVNKLQQMGTDRLKTGKRPANKNRY
ncbi:MAG: hypothetical protein JKY55_00985 [Aliivibrio sp.]|uniref:hypothetical protein n=1 Tax=Aliivibrio sp. TaxID=1872443 RepID=UPI001A4D7DDB|nr:hypothetical protein [Aliivibrio sp.]